MDTSYLTATCAAERSCSLISPLNFHDCFKSSSCKETENLQNDAEREGMIEAHLRDAVALCDHFSWFEDQMESGSSISEVALDEHLTSCRAAQPGYIGPSFPTIAGCNANGAIIHYRAQAETCKTIDASCMLLVDSGGQYDCGTTDITRTFHFGEPTAHQKDAYTRVLQVRSRSVLLLYILDWA
jgi:Xaa-Pro aminopeptidase